MLSPEPYYHVEAPLPSSRPRSDGCGGRGTSVVGAIDLGRASTTYVTPSSDAYEGGRGPDRLSDALEDSAGASSLRCQNNRLGSTR